MRHNTTKEKLKKGETVFGCFVRYANATLIEVMGHMGWDFILFDGEHGAIEPADCEQMTRAAELQGVTPMVRVPVNQPHVLLRFMDTGVHGVHVPMVKTAADAEAVVQSVKYQPRGSRGLATVRAGDYAQKLPFSFDQYVAEANAETLVVAHIETGPSIDCLPAILGVDGLDVAFLGPTDLSNSLGHPGDMQHPVVQAAFQRFLDAMSGSSVALGVMVSNLEAARQWKARGARYISISVEGVLGPACRSFLKSARE